MATLYPYLLPATWVCGAAYWWIASREVKPTVRRESPWSRLSYIGPLIIAAILLIVPRVPVPILGERFVHATDVSFAVGSVLTATGLLFAIWARRYLGPNWSGTVTIKEGHQLITGGPYAIVRHPIYAGLLLALAGSPPA